MAGSFIVSCSSGKEAQLKRVARRLSEYFENKRKQSCIGMIENGDCIIKKYGRASQNSYPLTHDEAGNVIVIDGIVFLDGYVSQKDLPRIVLEAYLHRGSNIVSKLQGHFAITIYNKKDNYITVITDINGMVDKYYYSNDHLCAFSSSALSLATALPTSYNLKALAEMFQMGQFISYETYFNEIRRCEAASIYSVSGNKIVGNDTYWSFPREVKEDLKFPDQIERIEELLEKYADLISKSFENVECDLTGGTDSRLVVSAMRKANGAFKTSFFDPEGTAELKVVREIARNTGLPFEHNKFEGKWPDDINLTDVTDLVWMSDGRVDPFEIFTTFYNQSMRVKKGADISLNGVGGIAYKEGWAEEMRIFKGRKFGIDPEMILKYRIFKNWATGYNFFEKEFGNYIRMSYGDGLENIRKLTRDCDELITPIAVDTFYFRFLGHDEIACHFNISNQIIATACPLTFKDIIEQVGVGNPKWRRWYSRLQRNLIFRLDRELARQKTLIGFPSIPFNALNFVSALPIVTFQMKRFVRKFGKLLLNLDIFRDTNKYDKDLLMRHLIRKNENALLFYYPDMKSKFLYAEENFRKFINDSVASGRNSKILRTIFVVECVMRLVGGATQATSVEEGSS